LSEAVNSDFILLGKIVRPHGLDGTLRVQSYADSPESFGQAGRVVLKKGHSPPRECRVRFAGPHKNVLLLRLEGIHGIEEAEAWRGAEIYIRKDALRAENDDEYFWHELIGLQVFLDTGAPVGTLTDILPTRGSDVYIVRSGDREILIPAVREVVREIDLVRKRLIIKEMEGLLDLNEV